jgi:RNA polymerase sigma factor (sigma-70 family)
MMRNETPPDLGARLRSGDEGVLEAILRAHGPAILALLKQRYVGPLTAGDFEDVLATALFRIWQNRTKFDSKLASLRVWFFRIAENVARDVLRYGWVKARQLETSVEPAHLALAVDRRWIESDAAATTPTLRIPADQLRELLALLPENQRRIVMADADSPDGLVASQSLATELGIPPSTVRVYRRRALERLRREIEQLELSAQVCEADA